MMQDDVVKNPKGMERVVVGLVRVLADYSDVYAIENGHRILSQGAVPPESFVALTRAMQHLLAEGRYGRFEKDHLRDALSVFHTQESQRY